MYNLADILRISRYVEIVKWSQVKKIKSCQNFIMQIHDNDSEGNECVSSDFTVWLLHERQQLVERTDDRNPGNGKLARA